MGPVHSVAIGADVTVLQTKLTLYATIPLYMHFACGCVVHGQIHM